MQSNRLLPSIQPDKMIILNTSRQLMPTTVRLTPETEARLDYLARATGRSKAFYLRQIVEDNLDDLEDIYLAEARLEQLRAGKSATISADEVWNGLED